jgi:hypothetical protein
MRFNDMLLSWHQQRKFTRHMAATTVGIALQLANSNALTPSETARRCRHHPGDFPCLQAK